MATSFSATLPLHGSQENRLLLPPIRLAPPPSSFLGSTRSLTIPSSRRLYQTQAARRSPVVGVQEVVKEKKVTNSLLITKEEGLVLYEDMILGRSFEDMCAQMYYRGKMFGFVHLYNGQEAVSTGFIKLLTQSDSVVSTYRDHVHALSKGVSARAVMSELFGKVTGCCRGQGGSMHMFSKEHNMLGGFAFIGEGIPVATGAAFTSKYKREGKNPILPSLSTMDPSKVVTFSRNLAVLVKLQGPDPKGLKMRKHAFHQYHYGNTTLSASGVLFPRSILLSGDVSAELLCEDGQDMALVLTVASLVEPFLTLGHRASISQEAVKLIPGARIEIMVEGQLNSGKEDPFWVPAQLLSLVDVPVSSAALQSLIETSVGSKDSGWDVGWSLVSGDTVAQPSTNMKHYSKPLMQRDEPNDAKFMAKYATRMALLGVSLSLLGQPKINLASPSSKGDTLVTLGSPFGILSPLHFFNSVSTGSISNCYSSGSLKNSLMIADVRCLPGMEGAPVFGKNGHLIGILIRPLRQKNSGVEVQLVVPWGAITAACSHLLLKEPSDEILSIKPDASIPVQVAVGRAMESICLITVNDGVWASGVVLNEQGLILTNAHLLEPWRFGKGGVVHGEGDDNGLRPHVLGAEEFSSTRSRFWEQECQTLPRKAPADLHVKKYRHSLLQTGHRDIRVRLCEQDSWTWCPAKVVYICKEQLDVALLQLEDAPGKLQPIAANFSSPPLGTPAHVVGHGLFGPRCGLSPSVCSGVVAKVVHTKKRLYTQPCFQGAAEFPAMLETTAAVHPGGSGGAVVNSSGHMIGLVTSNARHGAGTIIPHLNFSIPCAVLAPIFKFAQDMQNMEILQTLDQPNEELSSIWALMPSLSPEPKPNTEHSLPKLLKDVNNKQKKGSQFAKFIAETQEMFVKPTKLSRDVIPSKL